MTASLLLPQNLTLNRQPSNRFGGNSERRVAPHGLPILNEQPPGEVTAPILTGQLGYSYSQRLSLTTIVPSGSPTPRHAGSCPPAVVPIGKREGGKHPTAMQIGLLADSPAVTEWLACSNSFGVPTFFPPKIPAKDLWGCCCSQ